MMNKLYYQYTEVVLYYGITGLLIKLIIFSSLSIYEYENNIDGILNEINTNLKEKNILIVIFFQFLYYILFESIFCVLLMLMIFYLRPNYMIMTDQLSYFEFKIFYEDRQNKYYSIIPFVFQIIALLFYFEILELNFCNLNKNTAKNIDDRERNDIQRKKTDLNVIEFGDQYYLKDEELNGNDEDQESQNTNKSEKIVELKNEGIDN